MLRADIIWARCNYYPCLRGAEGTVLCWLVGLFVCLCVLPQNCCLNSIISTSKPTAAPKLDNLGQTVVLYKFFQASMAHNIACKFKNKKTSCDFIYKTFESS